MTDYIQAWQCVGCGKIEAPQPCIGVCRDRKVLMVGKDEHERALGEIERQRNQLERARGMLLRFAKSTPHDGQWQAFCAALQAQACDVLSMLSSEE